MRTSFRTLRIWSGLKWTNVDAMVPPTVISTELSSKNAPMVPPAFTMAMSIIAMPATIPPMMP